MNPKRFPFMVLVWIFGLSWSFFGEAPGAFAVDDTSKTQDAYEVVWESVVEAISRREYGSASSLLDAAVEETNLKAYGRQVAQDRVVLAGLQTLESHVQEAVAKLEEGAPVQISGADYTVIGYDRDPQKQELILLSKALRKEMRKPVVKLPTNNWVELARPRLASMENAPLILGVFVGFDQTPDGKLARKYFNEASTNGSDVKIWLSRLESIEAQRKEVALKGKRDGADDPIVGKWSLVAPNGLLFNITAKDDRTVSVFVPATTIVEMRKRKMPLPAPGNLKGKWTRDDSGLYRISWGAITVEMMVVGDRLVGRGPAGKVGHGTRMVD